MASLSIQPSGVPDQLAKNRQIAQVGKPAMDIRTKFPGAMNQWAYGKHEALEPRISSQPMSETSEVG
jgi:hypothetical protein